jgi:formylglycine-generating enzyme required for sulfatase activity
MLFALSGPAAAFLASDRIEMAMDIAVQANGEPPRVYCRESLRIERHHRKEWWLSFDPPPRHSGADNPFIGEAITCGTGTGAQTDAGPGGQLEATELSAESALTARLVRKMEDEKNLEVEVRISLRRPAGKDLQGKPVFRSSEIERTFQFSDSGSAIVPLQMTPPGQDSRTDGPEIYLRIAVSAAAGRESSALGTLVVRSELGDSDIYLDRGRAGRLEAGEDTSLRNVEAGMRLVEVLRADGTRVSQVVKVLPCRTVLTRFPGPDSGGPGNSPGLEPIGVNEQGFEEFRRRADGAVVVRIPAGEFLMGNRDTERTPLEHDVYLSEFFMDKTGVSWEQYMVYAAATGTPLPPHPPYWGFIDDHPAVYVTWAEAGNYCEWAGGRLPSEAEREKAARGADGRKFPWGDREPEAGLAQFRKSWGYEATAPVDSNPAGASPYGLLNMGGNVWEWCADWYGADYYEHSPYRDPPGPASGMAHVVRGGSWDSRPSVLSASCRSWGHPGYRDGDFGFRCVMNAPR